VDDERGRVLATDGGLALAAVAGCLLLGLAGLPEWYWSAVIAVSLVLRRRAPLVFLLVATTISAVHLLVSHSLMFPGDLVPLAAVHAMAAYAPDRQRHAGLLLGAVGGVLIAVRASGENWRLGAVVLPALLIAATTLAAWSTGLMQRQQRVAVLDAEHRRRLAEQDSELRAQLAVHEERTRISREMHDIIAHSLASIIAQAEGGRAAARSGTLAAGPLFDRIANIGRSSLTDVKRLLAVVEKDPGDGYALGLGTFPELLDGVRAAGLDVVVERTGAEVPLPPGLDLAVYRVVQESLTNVLKHAPAPAARLTLRWTPAALAVEVTSAFAGSTPTEGRGLSGIRQRCSLFGASCGITTGDGRLTVATTWPLT
jgi:signal transduction histidine kinase